MASDQPLNISTPGCGGTFKPSRWQLGCPSIRWMFLFYYHLWNTFFQNSQSHRNIGNYMAAIRAYHIIYGLNTVESTDGGLKLLLGLMVKCSCLEDSGC